MTIASIDIGSNTIILLIAKYDKSVLQLIPILNEFRIPRISQGLAIDGIITSDSLNRLLKGLDEFKDIIKTNNVDTVLVNATNAFRMAKNADSIKNLIEQRYKWKVNIISGEREAELTFLGIALPSFSVDDNFVLIDIGGGSTEIIYGNISKLLLKQSFQIGIVSLLEMCVHSDPPNNFELECISSEISKTFISLNNLIPPNQDAIAVAGTPTTLSSIMMNVSSYEDRLVENSELRREYITKFIESIKLLSCLEIKQKFGCLVNGREDLILIGAIILEKLMEHLVLDSITVSTKGLRYGAVWEYLMNRDLFIIRGRNGIPSE